MEKIDFQRIRNRLCIRAACDEYKTAVKTISRFYNALATTDPAFDAVIANWLKTTESLDEILRLKVGEVTGKLTG